jgi:hypothetical protein
MNRFMRSGLLAAATLFLSACSVTAPDSRLGAYVGSLAPPPAGSPEACVQRDVALLVVHDTKPIAAAPQLSPESLQRLSERIKARVEEGLPLKVVKVASPRAVSGDRGDFSWRHMAQEQGVDALLLAVVSLVEAKSRDRLPLDGSQEGGGAMGMLPGSTTSDYALVEFGLLDARADRMLARTEGRGAATLEQLDSGLTSNAYPVVRQPGKAQRYFPPKTHEEAQGLVTYVAVDDAIEQALYRWKACMKTPG